MSVMFDTLKFVKDAQKNGFSEQQAEFQAREFNSLMQNEIATKSDIKELKRDMEDIKKDMQSIKNDILIKLGSLMVVGMGVLGFILKN